jgi:radical SAM superfamily enzyme YgiQ (UPF0313 family)
MKLGLIYPSKSQKSTYSSSNAELQKFFDTNTYIPQFYLPSLSLLTIAGCSPPDAELKLIDERVDEINFDEHFDIVGISVMIEQAIRGYEISQKFRQKGVFTVMGGIHVSTLPEEAKKYCDCVVIGEGEPIWPTILADYKKGKIKQSYHNDKPFDLAKSPIPRYDLVDTSVFNVIPTQTTRGCPHDCSFCSVTEVYGPKFRAKSTNQIIDEIKAIQKVSKNRRIIFNDDNMFVNRKKSYKLLELLIPLKIKYFTQADISISEDEKLLDLMHQSGCVTIFVGLESLVSENLLSIQSNKWKYDRVDMYSEACKKIQSYGIQVLGSFIVGFDHDKKDVFERLIRFTSENDIMGQYHILTPFPGTKIRESMIKAKRLPKNDNRWDLYSCFDVIFPPKNMSKKELEAGLLNVYNTVYSRSEHLKRSRNMIDIFKNLEYFEQRL